MVFHYHRFTYNLISCVTFYVWSCLRYTLVPCSACSRDSSSWVMHCRVPPHSTSYTHISSFTTPIARTCFCHPFRTPIVGAPSEGEHGSVTAPCGGARLLICCCLRLFRTLTKCTTVYYSFQLNNLCYSLGRYNHCFCSYLYSYSKLLS